jgi:hypothetical protein
MHVGSQYSQIVFIVNSSSVNGILKDTINLLPLDTSSITVVLEIEDYSLSCFEITIREFVVFGPALRDISSSFLYESVEPRKDEEKLSLGQFQFLVLRWCHILESTHQVVADTWRSFIGDFQT